MRNRGARSIVFALVMLLALALSVSEAGAQRKRTKRSRRATNPITVVPVTTPTTQSTEPQIISTAEQQAAEQNNAAEVSGQIPASTRRKSRAARAAEASDEDSMQRTVNDLTNQVTKLSDKLSQMEQQQRTLVDLERLSRAEQRAEALRTQLRDVQEKEGNLSARMEQLNYDLKPENIERSVAGYGSTRPEDARDARQHSLENEKTRVQAQLDLLVTSRQRLEAAIVSSDLEVEKLRKRIEDSTEPQPKTDQTGTETNNPEETTTPQPASTNTNSSTVPPQS